METVTPTLTSYSKASGCGCKLPPALLHQMLAQLPPQEAFAHLLVGHQTADDASVLLLRPDLALIQTVDFFTPLVNDPYIFGKIAAANALSDVYAMGGTPAMANAVLAFPAEQLPAEVVAGMMQGAAEVCSRAGIPLAGGHTVNIGEVLFGLSVTGTVHPQHLKTNAGAQDGDLLLLTKPLGTGILGAALKRGMASPEDEAALAAVSTRLNQVGAALAPLPQVHALTDVTGFGLYGHLMEMCRGGGLHAVLHFEKIPLIEEARHYAAKFVLPDNAFRNANAVKEEVHSEVSSAFGWCNDPQTNGGLLIAVAPDGLAAVQAILAAESPLNYTVPIGFFAATGPKKITVQP